MKHEIAENNINTLKTYLEMAWDDVTTLVNASKAWLTGDDSYQPAIIATAKTWKNTSTWKLPGKVRMAW